MAMKRKFGKGDRVRIVRGRLSFPELEKYLGETGTISRYATSIKDLQEETIGRLYSVCMDKDDSIKVAPEDWLEPLNE